MSKPQNESFVELGLLPPIISIPSCSVSVVTTIGVGEKEIDMQAELGQNVINRFANFTRIS